MTEFTLNERTYGSAELAIRELLAAGINARNEGGNIVIDLPNGREIVIGEGYGELAVESRET